MNKIIKVDLVDSNQASLSNLNLVHLSRLNIVSLRIGGLAFE